MKYNMYLTNKYTKWYKNIIANAKKRANYFGYTEKHHIVPKSLGGSDTNDNLVFLTAKEHFLCHRLLPKMVEGEAKAKMIYAAWGMANLKNKNQLRKKINSNTYELLKKEWIEYRKTVPGPNLGRKMPEGFSEKQSLIKKGIPAKPFSEEHKKNLSKPKTEEHKKKLSESRLGKTWGFRHSDVTKEKMSSWQKGVSKPKHQCPYCKKEMSLMNLKKWHNDNCKLK
jgi:hypothetical protein